MEMTDKELSRALLITRAAFVFGAASTMLINLAQAQNGWGPKLVALIAPVSILFVVEMLLHIPKSRNVGYTILIRIMILLIGAAALTISYVHIAQLLVSYGESLFLAWVTPAVPDGMMVVSSVVMALVMRERDERQVRIKQEKEAEEARQRAAEEKKEADRVRILHEKEAEEEVRVKREQKEAEERLEAEKRAAEEAEEQRAAEERKHAEEEARFAEQRRMVEEQRRAAEEAALADMIDDEDDEEDENVEAHPDTTASEGVVIEMVQAETEYFEAPTATQDARPRARSTSRASQEHEQAREAYRRSTLSRYPMTPKTLGEQFGRSERWGQERISEVLNPNMA